MIIWHLLQFVFCADIIPAAPKETKAPFDPKAFAAKVLKEYKIAEKTIDHIDAATFQQTAVGDWLIFYGDANCGHCQLLTPVWLKLQIWAKETKSKFSIGKVECTTNTELCSGVDAFPMLRWYRDGELKDDKFDQRTFTKLKEFVTRTSKSYISPIQVEFANLNDKMKAETMENRSLNPEGKLVHLTADSFDERTKSEPWVIMFHAPWCGHCKGNPNYDVEFGPAYETVAGMLKYRANVAKVDCTTEKGIPHLTVSDMLSLFYQRIPDHCHVRL